MQLINPVTTTRVVNIYQGEFNLRSRDRTNKRQRAKQRLINIIDCGCILFGCLQILTGVAMIIYNKRMHGINSDVIVVYLVVRDVDSRLRQLNQISLTVIIFN